MILPPRPTWTQCRGGAVAALVTGAGVCGLFFHGDSDVMFAPALLLIYAAALLAVLLRQRGALPHGAIAGLALALWAYLAIGLLWSSVPYVSLLTWLVFGALPVAVLALGEERRLVPALLTGLTALGGFAVLQVTVWPQTYGARAHAPLLDANNLAALLNLGLLPALGFALHGDRRMPRRVALAGAVLLFAGLLATQSRAGLLTALLAALPLFWPLHWTPGRRGTRLAGGATAIALLAEAVLARSGATRYASLLQPGGGVNGVARLAIWRGALRLVAAHPWRGSGFGTFYLYYPAMRAPLLDNSTGNWAHNDLLQFWAEAGIVAPLLASALAVAAGRAAIRASCRTGLGTNERAEAAGLAAGLFAVALHSLVEFQFYVLPILIVAGVWLARLGSLAAPGRATIPLWRPPFRLPLLASGLALPLILLTLSCGTGQFYFQRAQAALAAGHVGDFLVATGRAEKLAPASYAEPKVMLAGFDIDLAGQSSPLFSLAERRQLLAQAGDLLRAAQALDPAWAEIDRKLARLAAVSNPPDPVAERLFLMQAVAKDPMNFQARRELALCLSGDGDAHGAYRLLAAGLAYPHSADVTTGYTALLRQLAPLAAKQGSMPP